MINPFFDIRSRDVDARAAFDPRFDRKRKRNTQLSIKPQLPTGGNQERTKPKTNTSKVQIDPPPKPAPIPETRIVKPITNQQPQKPTPKNRSHRRIVTGDSVATGIGHGGARGDSTTDAQWGRSSAEQLRYMKNKGSNYYNNADVTLSSGILNSPDDFESVEAQIKFLLRSGVNSVRLAGAPISGPYSKYNALLEALAAKYDRVTAIGPYESNDAVHPISYQDYR